MQFLVHARSFTGCRQPRQRAVPGRLLSGTQPSTAESGGICSVTNHSLLSMYRVSIVVDTPGWRVSETGLRTSFPDSATRNDRPEHQDTVWVIRTIAVLCAAAYSRSSWSIQPSAMARAPAWNRLCASSLSSSADTVRLTVRTDTPSRLAAISSVQPWPSSRSTCFS